MTTFTPYSIRIAQWRDRIPVSHVEHEGYVVYHRVQPDGDTHIKIAPYDTGNEATNQQVIEDFVMCEFPPTWADPLPQLHDYIWVQGLRRWDETHAWPEVHDVYAWGSKTPPLPMPLLGSAVY